MARRSTATTQEREGRGANLRRERKAQSLSLDALAAMVGLSSQQISKYERGESVVGATWAADFAQALGCPLLAIYRVEDTPAFDGVAEPAAVFHHEGADLAEVLRLADERLTGGRRGLLRTFALDLLDEQEAPRTLDARRA